MYQPAASLPETSTERLTTRVNDSHHADRAGQRALIASPPKAARQRSCRHANAITRKRNPECHHGRALVDERPEEVTDMQLGQRRGHQANLFDRPPSDHRRSPSWRIERAKRLVEQGDRRGAARFNHPARPRLQQRVAGVGRSCPVVSIHAVGPRLRYFLGPRVSKRACQAGLIATAIETGSTGDTVIRGVQAGNGQRRSSLTARSPSGGFSCGRQPF